MALTISAPLAGGCIDDMADQPSKQPLEASSVFADGMASRPVVPGTVARGQLRVDRALYDGRVDGQLVESFPLPVTAELLHRGQQRFDIYCAACHGRVGTGQGMVVQRGFPAPPSYHTQRLREAPVGHFYDVITHGFGRMYDYASELTPRDRWAVVAYIRALQLSQQVSRDGVELTNDEEAQLAASPPQVGADATLLGFVGGRELEAGKRPSPAGDEKSPEPKSSSTTSPSPTAPP